MTKNSALIWQLLQKAQSQGQHLTAEQVYLQAKQQNPRIAMATVYNNLHTLEQAGRIRRLTRGAGPDCYDANTDPHAHLVCDCCGRLADQALCGFKRELEQKVGTDIAGYELWIHYLCDDCKQKSA